ncbi:MAG: DUF882 domain-containing protein [Endozoicomonadaceae bacterium]|nr:DUF882 domain-containing protein [Endozoicomonadaceae bacterium]
MTSNLICSDQVAQQKASGNGISRRGFITVLAGTTLAAGFPGIVNARALSVKQLSFHNTHTGENLALAYYERGRYVRDALHEVNFVLRDHRTDEVESIDIALLDQLYDLRMMLGTNKPFHIISGYRSPYSNAQLSRKSRGVAKKSFHMQGRAIDVRIPGVSTRRLRNAAIALRNGGVGYYPRSGFVHLDTGNVRSWR